MRLSHGTDIVCHVSWWHSAMEATVQIAKKC